MTWIPDKKYKGIDHNQDPDGEWVLQAKFGQNVAGLGKDTIALRVLIPQQNRIHPIVHETSIPLDQLTGISMRPPGFMGIGAMWFQSPGYREQTPQNGLVVPKAYAASAEYFRDRVLAAAKEYSRQKRLASSVPPQPAQAGYSIADELRKLKALFDEGVLSPEEYEQAKRRVLG